MTDPQPDRQAGQIEDPFSVDVDAAIDSFWLSLESQDDLLGRRGIVITGAGRGLGRACAIDAARSGARMIVNDVDRKPAEDLVAEIASFGGESYLSTHDVADPEGAEALVTQAINSFGRLDGFVNNAGAHPEAPTRGGDPEWARRAVEVNLLGAVNCSIFAARVMDDGGSIVNASPGGTSGFPATATGDAAERGIAALTYGAALDLEERGIRINAVAPKASTAAAEAPVETIAPLLTFLLSDLAVGITGQSMRFDGRSLTIVATAAFADHPSQWVESWSPASLAAALDGPVGAAMRPFGVERRMPERPSTDGSLAPVDPPAGGLD